LSPLLLRTLTIAALFVTWIAATSAALVPTYFLPGPGDVWTALVDLLTNGYRGNPFLLHLGLSLLRVSLGFGTGSVVGTVLGVVMGRNRVVEALFTPLIEFFRPLPQISYLVLLIVWFGIGESAQVIVLFLAALPVAAVAARDGVRDASIQRIQVAHSVGATEWQVLRYVILPSALPQMFSGWRLAVGVVYATLVAAEMVGASAGLGWMILDAGRMLSTSYVFVGVFILGIVGLLLYGGMNWMETLVVHWAGRD